MGLTRYAVSGGATITSGDESLEPLSRGCALQVDVDSSDICSVHSPCHVVDARGTSVSMRARTHLVPSKNRCSHRIQHPEGSHHEELLLMKGVWHKQGQRLIVESSQRRVAGTPLHSRLPPKGTP